MQGFDWQRVVPDRRAPLRAGALRSFGPGLPAVAVRRDVRERARAVRDLALDRDAVAGLHPADGALEARRDGAGHAGHGDRARGDVRDVAARLDLLGLRRLGRVAAAPRDQDGLARAGAAAELAVCEAARGAEAGGEVREHLDLA